MRWGYIVPRVVLLGSVWAFLAFGFDPLLKWELINAGQQAAGAKVNVGAVQTKLFPPALSVGKTTVANRNQPGTNLVDFDSLSLTVAGGPLLKKLYIVEEGTLTGLKTGTPREDSGLFPETPAQKEARERAAKDSADQTNQLKEEFLARGKQFLNGLADRANLKFDPDQFESIRLGKELEKRWPAEFGKLQAEADQLKEQIDALEKMVQSNSGNKLERLDSYRQATTDATRVLEEVKQLKSELEAQSKQSRQDYAAFNQARQHDVADLSEKADLFRLDPQQLTETLLGPELNQRLNRVLSLVQTAKSHFADKKEQPAGPPPMRGREITFAREPALPPYLLKLLNVSGEAQLDGQTLEFNGTVSGITSDPVIYGQPAILLLKGEGAADLDLKAIFDYTDPQSEPKHEVLLSYAANNPDALNLGSEDLLSVSVSGEKLICRAELKLIGEAITGKVILKQAPAHLTAKLGGKAAEVDPHLNAVVADIFGAIQEIDAEMRIGGTLAAPKWAIQSNLGQQVAGGLSSALSKELEGERAALSGQLDQQLSQQAGRLQGLFKQNMKGITGQLNGHEQDIQQLVQQVTGGRLAELEKVVGKPLDGLKKPSNGKKSGIPVDFSKEEDQAKEGLKKLFGK